MRAVDAGMVQFGPIELPYPHEHRHVDGEASVFVRPHDVTIDTKTNGLPAMSATVERVHSAGAAVRVELRTMAGQSLCAELSQERFGTMHLGPGSVVYVRPRHIRVFANGRAAS